MGYSPLDYMYSNMPESLCPKMDVKTKYDTFNRLKHAIDLSLIEVSLNLTRDNLIDQVKQINHLKLCVFLK